jgi:DNA transposition AAA+ family ATPase
MTIEDLPDDDSDFIVTGEYLKFEEFCKACSKHRYVGICYGTPGVGKTLSARYFAQQDFMDQLHWSNLAKTSKELRSALYKQVANCPTLYYVAPVFNTPRRIADAINFALGQKILNKYAHPGDAYKLLIIDEADHLQVNSLEQVRAIYDERKIGVILIGMPGMEKRLARYPQLYSRIGFSHEFKAISKKDIQLVVDYYLSKHGIPCEPDKDTYSEALAMVIRITNGNFRLVDRLFRQIKRIMEINNLQSIGKDAVEAARDCLVIGNT